MEVNPIEVQKHLKGVEYPAGTGDVVAAAERNGAPEKILQALRAVDQEEFEGPNAVQAALG